MNINTNALIQLFNDAISGDSHTVGYKFFRVLIIYAITLLAPWQWFTDPARPAFEALRQDGPFVTWGFRRALEIVEDVCGYARYYYLMNFFNLLVRKAALALYALI
jgi:hypothetical protein